MKASCNFQGQLLLRKGTNICIDVLQMGTDFMNDKKHMVSATGPNIKEVVKPRFSFGVITDIQYADIPNGCSFSGIPRFYRHSLQALQRAVNSWKVKEDLSFVIHLGDIVDGLCPKENSYAAVSQVLNVFGDLQDMVVYHVIGNHCLYNLPRDKLNHMLQIPTKNGTSYYTFSPATGFRIIVLDGFDISVMGWPEGHPHHEEATCVLKEKNPNENRNSPEGLLGMEERFVMFNGGIGKEQLSWLDKALQEAMDSKEKVIICCHIALHPDATYPHALLWNYSEVLDVIHKFSCVKLCLAGHSHSGGYTKDSHGIHHRVLEAVLECPPGTDAYGQIDVYEHCISLAGVGRMESADMYFD